MIIAAKTPSDGQFGATRISLPSSASQKGIHFKRDVRYGLDNFRERGIGLEAHPLNAVGAGFEPGNEHLQSG